MRFFLKLKLRWISHCTTSPVTHTEIPGFWCWVDKLSMIQIQSQLLNRSDFGVTSTKSGWLMIHGKFNA